MVGKRGVVNWVSEACCVSSQDCKVPGPKECIIRPRGEKRGCTMSCSKNDVQIIDVAAKRRYDKITFCRKKVDCRVDGRGGAAS